MSLLFTHPKYATRSCIACRKYVFNEETGNVERDRNGNPEERPAGIKLLCELPGPFEGTCCPKGTPKSNIALSDQNWLAYQHYQECRAVGQFPDDPVVRRNASIIRQIEDAQHRNDLVDLIGSMIHA